MTHRPPAPDQTIVRSSAARAELDWTPQVDFRGLVEMMVDADLARYEGAARAR